MKNVVVLLDFDNTLSDNDHLLAQFHAFLTVTLGQQNSHRFWEISEQLREQLHYVDYLGAIQRYRTECNGKQDLTGLASFLFDYPYSKLLYHGVFDTLHQLKKWGRTIILTDGDMVFQPYKIKASGLWHLLDAAVLIYIHKENNLAQMQQKYPSTHYVIVDDKVAVLKAIQEELTNRVTTVFMEQGHYAREWEQIADEYSPDFTIQHISQLLPIVHRQRHGN